MRRRLLAAIVAVVAVPSVASASTDPDGPETLGPSVSTDRSSALVGEGVWVTITDFPEGWVTLAVCGNEARRGSPDCNMIESSAAEVVDPSTAVVREVRIVEPPAPCPCVIRVTDRTTTFFAQAPVEIVGHPVEETVDGAPVNADLRVGVSGVVRSDSPLTWVKSRLGGEAVYDVTVTVRNMSNTDLVGLRLTATAGREEGSDLLELAFDDPGALAAGQTWRQTLTATVPAPSFDPIQWRVFVSGAGPTVSAFATSEQSTRALQTLVVIFVVCLGLLVVRSRIRRRMRVARFATG